LKKKKRLEKRKNGKMSEVCNRKCALCGNWTRGTEGVVCDNCVELLNKNLFPNRKGSKMNERLKISVKCHNCGFTEEDAGKGLRFIATSLMCCKCGFQAETQAAELPEPQSSMTFMEAVEAMKQGKRVRRGKWEGDGSIKLVQVSEIIQYGIMWDNDAKWIPWVSDFYATDWEIVK
jgi:hypothetical protein